jgi:hypothetical protein
MCLYVKIINDGTGSKSRGNYKYEVAVNDQIIESGEIKGHIRCKGAGQLIKLVGMDVDHKKFTNILDSLGYDVDGYK